MKGMRYKGYWRFYVMAAALVAMLLGLIWVVVSIYGGMPPLGVCIVLLVLASPALGGAYLAVTKGRAIRQEQLRREEELRELTQSRRRD